MLEFAQLLIIKEKDSERWTVDGSTLQDTWLSQNGQLQLKGNQCKQQILIRKNFHLFEKMVKELQRSASCCSISMTEFSLPLKRVMEGDVPASLLEYI